MKKTILVFDENAIYQEQLSTVEVVDQYSAGDKIIVAFTGNPLIGRYSFVNISFTINQTTGPAKLMLQKNPDDPNYKLQYEYILTQYDTNKYSDNPEMTISFNGVKDNIPVVIATKTIVYHMVKHPFNKFTPTDIENDSTSVLFATSISLNADEISKLVNNNNNIDDRFSELNTKVDTAQTSADNALEKANSVTDIANNANTVAGYAKETAEGAKTLAEQANQKATDAQIAADGVKDIADEANLNASNAIKQADKAASTAEAAKTTADAVRGIADDANSAANRAEINANDAKNTADTAVSTANRAIDTANSINLTAQEAKEQAVAANTKSEEALSTANGIKDTADRALTSATQAFNKSDVAINTANDAIGKADTAQLRADSAYTLADTANKAAEAASTSAATANNKADKAAQLAASKTPLYVYDNYDLALMDFSKYTEKDAAKNKFPLATPVYIKLTGVPDTYVSGFSTLFKPYTSGSIGEDPFGDSLDTTISSGWIILSRVEAGGISKDNGNHVNIIPNDTSSDKAYVAGANNTGAKLVAISDSPIAETLVKYSQDGTIKTGSAKNDSDAINLAYITPRLNEKQNISDQTLLTNDKTIVGAINEINSKSIGQSVPSKVYDDYDAFGRDITNNYFDLNKTKENFPIGISIYIKDEKVSDLWVSGYNNRFITPNSKDVSKIGWLETNDLDALVDLSGYVTTEKLSSEVATLNESIDTKVQKRTESGIVYGTEDSGIGPFNTIGIQYNVDPYGNGIVKRTSDGRVKTAKATENDDAITFEQFNTSNNNKLTKVTGVTTNDQAYIKNTAGEQQMAIITEEATANALVKRTADGRIISSPGVSENEVVTVLQINGIVDGKLDEVSGVTLNDQLYGKLADGTQQMINVSDEAKISTIAKRDENGRLKVSDAIASDDAVNKSQLESSVSGKLDANSEVTDTDKVYIKTANGTQGLSKVSPVVLDDLIIVQRSTGGRIKSTDAISDDELVTLSQVNTKVLNKLDKITGLTPLDVAYIKTSDGSQGNVSISNSKSNDTLVKRKNDGRIEAATATSDFDVVVFNQFTTGLSGKLDKITNAASTERVYSISTSGEQSTKILSNFNAINSIPLRTDKGNIEANTDTPNDNTLINKKYADTNYSSPVKSGTGELSVLNKGNTGDALGYALTALGYNTNLTANYSFAAGLGNTATGQGSVAMGLYAHADNDSAVALGLGVFAVHPGQIALGKYNVGSSPNNILEVGIGTSSELSSKKNGLELSGTGNLTVAGEVHSTLSSNPSEDTLITKKYFDEHHSGGITEIPIASDSVLGGIKVGANLLITKDGTLNAESGKTTFRDWTVV